MSNPGFFNGDPMSMQQAAQNPQALARMAMAKQLMGNQANPNTPYAGISNAAGAMAGAQMYRSAQAQSDPVASSMAQRTGMSPTAAYSAMNPSVGSRASDWLSKLFSMGGGT